MQLGSILEMAILRGSLQWNESSGKSIRFVVFSASCVRAKNTHKVSHAVSKNTFAGGNYLAEVRVKVD